MSWLGGVFRGDVSVNTGFHWSRRICRAGKSSIRVYRESRALGLPRRVVSGVSRRPTCSWIDQSGFSLWCMCDRDVTSIVENLTLVDPAAHQRTGFFDLDSAGSTRIWRRCALPSRDWFCTTRSGTGSAVVRFFENFTERWTESPREGGNLKRRRGRCRICAILRVPSFFTHL